MLERFYLSCLMPHAGRLLLTSVDDTSSRDKYRGKFTRGNTAINQKVLQLRNVLELVRMGLLIGMEWKKHEQTTQ